MSSLGDLGIDLPVVQGVGDDEEKCGKFVGKDGERDLFCDLPKGHSDACSAPVDNVSLSEN